MAYSIKKEDVIKYEPNELRNFKLFIHEYIDNLNFTFKPADFLSNADEYLKFASELFSNAGWYGDGEIQLIWVPPFIFNDYTNNEDANGIVIWHVKQKEDGISWLLSPIEFPIVK
ncbi:hypothetical protein [Flavobacterium sp. I3-2]|uniref:hypothetical protein n=1 Tax=Flavobacterium sp. I3-2 TaxID=2748319 RepID=UPI0015A9C7F4|nr:hypothetical protein [Flavobacterium sp. I3-2]